MSVFNIKNRCNDLDMTLTELYEQVKDENPQFSKVTFDMFSNMHRGRYNYGKGPAVMSAANEILNRKEKEKARKNAS